MLNNIWVYTKTSRIMLVLLAILLVLLATQNWLLGLLSFIVVAACVVYIKRSDFKQEKLLMQYLDDLSAGVSAGTVYAVKNLPVGIALMDQNQKLVWVNNVYRSWTGGEAQEGRRFQDLVTGQRIDKIWGKTGWFDCFSGGTYFRVFHKFLEAGQNVEQPFMVFYFMDRTDVHVVTKEAQEAMPVFTLVRIDNIPEVTSDMTDVEKSALLSDVTEKVLSYFSGHDGFIKQYSSADFVACLSVKALHEIMESNFDILDQVRNIHTVNRIPVTLSIGVVQSRESFAKQFEEAQVSMDLALGRGGDQAIVRIGKEVKAFGGRSPTAVSSTRVRVRVVAQALKEIISNADEVLVMGHAHEDFDCLGAAIGVSHLARASHVKTHIVLSNQLDTCRKMVDEIKKDPEEAKLLIDEDKAKNLITDKTIVVVVDTHIPDLVAAPSVLKKAQKKVVIDHHRRAASIIEGTLLTYMEPSASSASELVSELVQYYGGDKELSNLEASCLYAGIVVDTKNFAVQTSVRTFDAASYLRRCGADTRLVRVLFSEDIHFVQEKARVLSSLKTVDQNLAFAVCPKDAEESQILAGQIADYLVTVKGVHGSFLFYYADNHINCSARSDGMLNVQVIMEALGGGGHQTVAGTRLPDGVTIEQAEKVIIEEAEKQNKEE
jgi:c-di-AMP phosphodiesterase-like protein